jgi:hypothetical protein
MAKRGTFEFETDARGHVADNAVNLERLRKLWLDETLVEDIGPGNPGDFDHGAWHVACHLLGGTGAFETKKGRASAAITYDAAAKSYMASLTYRDGGNVVTKPLASPEVKALLADGARCLGFVEGSSEGHISARGVSDAASAFNKWPRQMFDQDITSEDNGGTVWEHWCTVRDIRPTAPIGTACLQAYLSLLSLLGGRYLAAVARGRRSYGHPGQLKAMVRAGLVSADDALWSTKPLPIAQQQQDELYEARPADTLGAIEALDFAGTDQKYFMFKRAIAKWSDVDHVRRDLGDLARPA